MSNTILPKLFQLGVNALVQNKGDPIKTVQTTVAQVRQAVDTFATNVTQRAQEGRLFSPFAWGPRGEPYARQLEGVNVGMEGQRTDPVGEGDSVPHGVEIVQQFLGRLGYLDTGHQLMGTFNGDTAEAVRQFQRDNGLEETGVVDDATVAAMLNPRPRPGHGMPVNEAGRYDPNGSLPLTQTLFQEAANLYGEQLGLPTGAAVTRQDGSVVQQFEHGSLERTPQGGFRILDTEGNPLFPQTDYAAVRAEAEQHFISQFAGDPNSSNKNCGYASSAMSLSYLGVPGFDLRGLTDEQAYGLTMDLREVGQPDTADSVIGSSQGIYGALTTQQMQEAGVEVEVWANEYDGARQGDADRMALEFMNAENDNIAFVVGGNPAEGWGDTAGMSEQYTGGVYEGAHFISVVGYNPETDSFLVLEPAANGPIEVPRQDMVEYMQDEGVRTGEVMQITYNPPEGQTQP